MTKEKSYCRRRRRRGPQPSICFKSLLPKEFGSRRPQLKDAADQAFSLIKWGGSRWQVEFTEHIQSSSERENISQLQARPPRPSVTADPQGRPALASVLPLRWSREPGADGPSAQWRCGRARVRGGGSVPGEGPPGPGPGPGPGHQPKKKKLCCSTGRTKLLGISRELGLCREAWCFHGYSRTDGTMIQKSPQPEGEGGKALGQQGAGVVGRLCPDPRRLPRELWSDGPGRGLLEPQTQARNSEQPMNSWLQITRF